MKLTLLGTGNPQANPQRRGSSQIVEAGNDLILIDCGAGAMHRLVEAGYGQRPISRLLLTHLHSDHVTGLADLLWAGWVGRWWQEPPLVVGPPGAAFLIEKLIEAHSYDIRIRLSMEGSRIEALKPQVVEIDEGWTGETDGTRIEAFRVDHRPVDEAFGFRLTTDDASIAISGDTCWSDNLISHCQGVDLLVHEVYFARGMRAYAEQQTDQGLLARYRAVSRYHTPSDEVGKIATATGARDLVLSHLMLRGGGPGDLLPDIEPDYRGKITVGNDLQSFEIGSRPV